MLPFLSEGTSVIGQFCAVIDIYILLHRTFMTWDNNLPNQKENVYEPIYFVPERTIQLPHTNLIGNNRAFLVIN
jgi:hypothetical protein